MFTWLPKPTLTATRMISPKNILLTTLLGCALQTTLHGFSKHVAVLSAFAGFCVGTLIGIQHYIGEHPDWRQQKKDMSIRTLNFGALGALTTFGTFVILDSCERAGAECQASLDRLRLAQQENQQELTRVRQELENAEQELQRTRNYWQEYRQGRQQRPNDEEELT